MRSVIILDKDEKFKTIVTDEPSKYVILKENDEEKDFYFLPSYGGFHATFIRNSFLPCKEFVENIFRL